MPNLKNPLRVISEPVQAWQVMQRLTCGSGDISSRDDVTQEIQRLKTHKENQENQRETTSVRFSEIETPTESPHPEQHLRDSRKARGDWFREFASTSLNAYIAKAYRFQFDTQEREEWHTELFWFVWLIRGHRDMVPLHNQRDKAWNIVDNLVCAWSLHRRGPKQDPPPFGFVQSKDHWQEWFGMHGMDARAEFADVWTKCRFTPGHAPLQQAFDAARQVRLLLPDEIRAQRPVLPSAQRSEQDYEFFVSVAGHLQVIVGDKPIKMPCVNVAALLGVSKMTVSRYRRWAEADGFLTKTRDHAFRSKGKGDATEFRFPVERYDSLAKKAQARIGD